MTKEEFDTLKVGDILTNKIIIENKECGYDYEVIEKTENKIDVNVISIMWPITYTIKRDKVEGCLNFRKK